MELTNKYHSVQPETELRIKKKYNPDGGELLLE
jgi:hypothetical protein